MHASRSISSAGTHTLVSPLRLVWQHSSLELCCADSTPSDLQEAIIEDAGEPADSGRDLVHGDGGTIELPTRPGDLSKDD